MKGMRSGDVVMDHDGGLTGMVGGDVIVRSGSDVRISGMVAGDVYVEPGTFACITGMVSGAWSSTAVSSGSPAWFGG